MAELGQDCSTRNIDVYLGLGTNLGDKKANIFQALELLSATFGRSYKRLSSLIETEPWGFDSEDQFLNCVVMYELPITIFSEAESKIHYIQPSAKYSQEECFGLEILRRCKAIETAMGRVENIEYKDGKRVYHSRIIDIDILLLGDLRLRIPASSVQTTSSNREEQRPILEVPHPLMHEREFVMMPLNEIYVR